MNVVNTLKFKSLSSRSIWFILTLFVLGMVVVGLIVYNVNSSSSETETDQAGSITEPENPTWKELKPFRGKTRTNGKTGKKKRYYEWDHTHKDVEVYDRNGNHLGSMDPKTGRMTKPSVKGRTIDIE